MTNKELLNYYCKVAKRNIAICRALPVKVDENWEDWIARIKKIEINL